MTRFDLDRRTFLKATGTVAVAGAVSLGEGGRAAADEGAVPFSAGTERPRVLPPPGATDCHMHVYDSRYPPAPYAKLRPPDAHVEDYRRLQRRLGLARTVVVQTSTYGTDNRITLDALASFGASARGVAVFDPTVADAELARVAALGVRGIRFNLVQAGATTIDMIEPLARRVAPLGWVVQIHMKSAQIADAEALLSRLPAVTVFDHLGRVPPASGVRDPGFAALRRLIERGRTWVKFSGFYQDSVVGPPSYADIAPVAKALVAAAPERMVWASDWPHPTEHDKPDDAILFDRFVDWAPDEAVRKRILVDNAEELFAFPKVGR